MTKKAFLLVMVSMIGLQIVACQPRHKAMLFADQAEEATGLEILHIETQEVQCGQRIHVWFFPKGTYAESILAICEDTFEFLLKDEEYCEAAFYLVLKEEVWTLEHGKGTRPLVVLYIVVSEKDLPLYYEMRTGKWAALRDFLNTTSFFIPLWQFGGKPFEKAPNHYDARMEALKRQIPWLD